MRRSRMALIAAVGMVALSASILQAQMFGRRSDAARDRAAEPVGAAANGGSRLAPPARGVRQSLRNGLDYLDHYGDPGRALPYLREAEARQQELNPTERRKLADALARAGQLLASRENGAVVAQARDVIGSTTTGTARAATSTSVHDPEASIQQVAVELPAPGTSQEPGEPELPGNLDLLGAAPPLSAMPAPENASAEPTTPADISAESTAPELPALPASPTATEDDQEPTEPIGLTILSDPSDHLEANEPPADPAAVEPATEANDAPPAEAGLMEPPPALPAPDFEAPPPATLPEISNDSDPSSSTIQRSESGVLLIPPPPRDLSAEPTAPEPAVETEADIETASPPATPPVDGDPMPDRLAAGRSARESVLDEQPAPPFADNPAEAPAPEASMIEPPLPVPDGLPGIDLSRATSGSSDPASAIDPESLPATVPEASAATVSEPPSTPPSPLDAEPAAGDFPPLPVEATAIPRQDPPAASDDAPASALDAGMGVLTLEDLTPSTATLRPETLREVEEIARRQDEESRRNPRVYQPGASILGENTDAPGGGSQINLPRAPSPTEARPLKPISVPEEFERLEARNFTPRRKYWAASATPHMPLYFQDAVLERYGQSVEQSFGPAGRHFSYPLDDPRQSNQRMQLLQPAYSAGLFAAQIVALPFNVFMDPPWEAQYDLGYFRPGDPVPPDLYYLPWSGLGPALHGNQYGRPRGPSIK